MSTLTLNPAIAAARRAAKAANPCPSITPVPQTQPRPSCATPARVQVSSILARLRDRWPKLFDPDQPRPLKIGIHKDIRAAGGFSGKELSRAMKVWTKRSAYLLQIELGHHRFDLDGLPCGSITTAQQSHAKATKKSPAFTDYTEATA